MGVPPRAGRYRRDGKQTQGAYFVPPVLKSWPLNLPLPLSSFSSSFYPSLPPSRPFLRVDSGEQRRPCLRRDTSCRGCERTAEQPPGFYEPGVGKATARVIIRGIRVRWNAKEIGMRNGSCCERLAVLLIFPSPSPLETGEAQQRKETFVSVKTTRLPSPRSLYILLPDCVSCSKAHAESAAHRRIVTILPLLFEFPTSGPNLSLDHSILRGLVIHPRAYLKNLKRKSAVAWPERNL
jgi:hypothetical protein